MMRSFVDEAVITHVSSHNNLSSIQTITITLGITMNLPTDATVPMTTNSAMRIESACRSSIKSSHLKTSMEMMSLP